MDELYEIRKDEMKNWKYAEGAFDQDVRREAFNIFREENPGSTYNPNLQAGGKMMKKNHNEKRTLSTMYQKYVDYKIQKYESKLLHYRKLKN